MLSGLSIANIPTAASLSNSATQQLQPNTNENNTGSNSANVSETQNNNNQAEINSSNKSTDNSNHQNTETGSEEKSFKEVINKTVGDNQSTNNSKTTTSSEIDASANSEDSSTDIETEEMIAIVSQVLATINAALANLQEDITINLDIKVLSIEELNSYATAIELIDSEVQQMMTDTIDQISDIEMTDLSALTEKSEILDDLQSLHEELSENLDEIEFLIDQSSTSISISQEAESKSAIEEDTGVQIEGFESVERFELKAVNAEIKPEREKETVEENNDEIQLKQEINLEGIKRDKPQEQQFNTNIKEEVQVQKAEQINIDSSQESGTEMQVQDQAVKVEIKEKANTNSDSFLDKIKFISNKETNTASKEQISNKANIDASTRQAVIQAADEIKASIQERAQGRIEQSQEKTIEINLEQELVDVTDNNSNTFFGRLVTDTFKQLNLSTKAEVNNYSPKEVINIVQEKVISTPVNTQQELKFQLNPKNLGNITITISRDASGVNIQMVVDTDAAVSSLKQDMSNLSSALKEKGLEIKDIDISKASSEGAYNQQQQRGDFNEAREEQKKRMTEEQPHWLQNDESKPNFESQLKGMLNLWRSKV